MPLTPIACPACGNIMQANALDKEGAVTTPCRECGELVYVQTDDEGRVEAIFGNSSGGAEAYAAAHEEDEEGAVRPSLKPLILLGLGLLFLFWVATTRFCSRRPVSIPESLAAVTPTPFLAASPAPTPFRERVFDELSGINFAFDSVELTEKSRVTLREVSESIKLAPRGTLYEISGHTDNVGSAAGNQKLSEQRAEAVKQFLVRQGVPAEMLRARGYGADSPLESNLDEAGRSRNRRIAIRLVTTSGNL